MAGCILHSPFAVSVSVDDRWFTRRARPDSDAVTQKVLVVGVVAGDGDRVVLHETGDSKLVGTKLVGTKLVGTSSDSESDSNSESESESESVTKMNAMSDGCSEEVDGEDMTGQG